MIGEFRDTSAFFMVFSASPASVDGAPRGGTKGPGSEPQRVRREQAIGLAILGTTFVLALVISWLVRRTVHEEVKEAPAAPVTEGLHGFPEHFDAVTALDRARELSLRKGLFGIELQGVRSNGTLALKDGGQSFARFILGSRRGEGPQPPVPPGERRNKDYCGRQEVVIDESGIRAKADKANHNCRGLKDWLPDPACGPAQVWQYALKHQAPPEALADLKYYQAAGGPAWRFSIANTAVDFVLDRNCKQELSDDVADGELP
ncbi:MAG TPA: hypothetical protein VL137_08360 [Polyangiaceae bacterium]|nr:hypothetical protein [Polyangiaceae bacterium]